MSCIGDQLKHEVLVSWTMSFEKEALKELLALKYIMIFVHGLSWLAKLNY